MIEKALLSTRRQNAALIFNAEVLYAIQKNLKRNQAEPESFLIWKTYTTSHEGQTHESEHVIKMSFVNICNYINQHWDPITNSCSLHQEMPEHNVVKHSDFKLFIPYSIHSENNNELYLTHYTDLKKNTEVESILSHLSTITI